MRRFCNVLFEGNLIGVVSSGGTDYDTSQYSIIRKEIANAVLLDSIPSSYCKFLLDKMEGY